MKKAFTLAEVLITLGIIGVVAAMTLPSLIQKQQEQETVVRVKKVYSLLSQALMAEISENGTVDNWGLGNTVTGEKDDNGLDVVDVSGREKFAKVLHKHLKSELIGVSAGRIKQYNLKGDYVTVTTQDYGEIPCAIKLPGGEIVTVGNTSINENCSKGLGACVDITLLLPSKKYIQGKTSFSFRGYKDRILPAGYQNATAADNPFETRCVGDQTTRQAGRGCTAWVILNENMDYLRCPEKLGWDKARSCKE